MVWHAPENFSPLPKAKNVTVMARKASEQNAEDYPTHTGSGRDYVETLKGFEGRKRDTTLFSFWKGCKIV